MQDEELVTICTVTNPAEAEIIRSALESAGIPCQIGGEVQGGFTGVWEIDILTSESDGAKAQKHLRQLKRNIRVSKQRRAAARKAKADGVSSEAIQELKPDADIRRPAPE
jgi:hypothetical protein